MQKEASQYNLICHVIEQLLCYLKTYGIHYSKKQDTHKKITG